MNIFYLDHNIEKCCEYHCDKHVVKMILEYAQLLSTTHRVLDGENYILKDFEAENTLCKCTHVNHPCAKWARLSNSNYEWLFNLFECLLSEYTYRYEKIHKYSNLVKFLKLTPDNIENGTFTIPTQCMPEIYKVENDSITAYHNYYNGAKRHIFNWKKRQIPYFVIL